MRWFPAFLLAAGLVVPAASATAAEAPEAKQIIQAIELPSVDLNIGFELTPDTVLNSGLDPKLELAQLGQSLKGDGGDADRYRRIGQLRSKQGDAEGARTAYGKAAELYRQELRREPQSGVFAARLASCLNALGEADEAERQARAAVTMAPKAWSGWAALGEVLQTRAWRALVGANAAGRPLGGGLLAQEEQGRLLEALISKPPTPDRLDRAEKIVREARISFDTAVARGAREPEAFLARAGSRVMLDGISGLIATCRAGGDPREVLARSVLQTLLGEPFGEDLRQLSALRPEDPRLIGFSAFLRFFGAVTRAGAPVAPGEGTAWKALGEMDRKEITAVLNRLARLGAGMDRPLAAQASEFQGALQFLVVGDRAAAEISLRRAVERDPSRDQAWDLLMGLMLEGKTPGDLLSVADARVKATNTARNRLLLAKAKDRAGDLPGAIEESRAAVKLDPGGLKSNLLLAALLAKSGDRTRLGEATALVVTAGKAPGIQPEEQFELIVTEAAVQALSGEVDAARKNLEMVLKQSPELGRAKRLLAALKGP